MIPLVSDKYRYILFYNPKSACSVLRKVFVELHEGELAEKHQKELQALRDAHQDDWHDINRLFPMRRDTDYSDYYKFAVVRHPMMRFISAYLNRIVLGQADLEDIEKFLKEKHGEAFEPTYCFDEFVDYVTSCEPGRISDVHFLDQTHTLELIKKFALRTPNHPLIEKLKYKWRDFRYGPTPDTLTINHICKVESLSRDLQKVYSKIFKSDAEMSSKASKILKDLPMHNVTFASQTEYSNASKMSAQALRELGKMPSYESFLHPAVIQKLAQHYREDFYNYGYNSDVSSSLKKFEANKKKQLEALVPDDFEWQHYLAANADLGANGIDNKAAAISHWIHHGRFEDRVYRNDAAS